MTMRSGELKLHPCPVYQLQGGMAQVATPIRELGNAIGQRCARLYHSHVTCVDAPTSSQSVRGRVTVQCVGGALLVFCIYLLSYRFILPGIG